MGTPPLEGNAMNTLLLIAMFLQAADGEAGRARVIVVTGAPGTEEYGEMFRQWAGRWEQAAKQAEVDLIRIGNMEQADKDDHELMQEQLQAAAKSDAPAVWLVLIGHGTFLNPQAKFNLNGPDVTAEELDQWLKPLEMPVAVVNCASASGPFINKLSGPNRVVVTATKSGSQLNFSRFGDYMSSAIAEGAADLDKDGQTSLLEAYLQAAAGVAEFYEQEARLATEHSLLDDNGDGLGTPADWFRGFRAVKSAKEGAMPDGQRASQFVLVPRASEANMPAEVRQRRDEPEIQVEQLRSNKSQLSEAEYYARLEPLMVELAELYRGLEQGE